MNPNVSAPVRLGLIVNPIAGMGGKVALKGTDGKQALRLARERGAEPVAGARADRALTRLRSAQPGVYVLAAPGPMGADLAGARSFATESLVPLGEGPTSAQDTKTAAAEMLRREGAEFLSEMLQRTVDPLVVRRRLAASGFPDSGPLVLGLVRLREEPADYEAVADALADGNFPHLVLRQQDALCVLMPGTPAAQRGPPSSSTVACTVPW